MEIGDLEPITGGERELFEPKKGRFLVFKIDTTSTLPDCPNCGHNRKVYKAADVFVCSNFHDITHRK